MGQTEGKDNNQLQLLYQEFSLVRRFNDEGIYGEGSLLQHKNNVKLKVFLKEINLTDEFQFNKALRKFDNRAKLSHPNVLQLIKHFHVHESQLCGQFFRLYVVFEYCDFSLVEFQYQKFQEEELWNYLVGSVSALAFFQQQQLRHDNINLGTIQVSQNDGTVKIADSSILKPINMFTQVLQHPHQTSGLYLSPILVKAISQNNWQPKHNSFKSDVFSLGMTFLHLSLKESLDNCYKYQEGIFKEDILNQKIQLLQQRYPGNISKIIIQMLFVQEQQRPDFIQLYEIIQNTSQNTPHFQVPPQNQGLQTPFQLSQQSTQQLVQPPTPTISQKQNLTHAQEQSIQFNQSVLSQQDQQEQFQNPFRQQEKQIQRKDSISSQQSQIKNQDFTHSPMVGMGRQNFPTFLQGPVNESVSSQQQYPITGGSRISQNSNQQLYQFNGINTQNSEDFSQRTQQQPFQQQALNPQQFLMMNNYKESNPMNRTYQDMRSNNQDLRMNTMLRTNTSDNYRENSTQKYQQSSTKNQNTPAQVMFPYQQPIMPQTQLFSDLFFHKSPFLLGTDQPDYLFPTKFIQNKFSNISYPDENIDPTGDFDQLKETKHYQNNGSLLRLSKTHDFELQQGFKPLRDYTNLFQIKDQDNELQNQQPNDDNEKNQSYLKNQAYQQGPYQKKDQFSVPFDLPNNYNSYGYNSVDQELQQEVQRSFQKQQQQQIHDQGRPPINQYYKPQQQQLEYVIEQYPNGSRYDGEKLNGMRHGKGKFSYSDGGIYDGQWKENKMHGKGILYYASGKPAYDGDWSEDQFQGQGTLFNETPFQLNYEFDFRDFDLVEDYWVKYQGQFNDDNKEGQGTLYLTNGEKFVGFFSKDFINGPGKFFTISQRVFEGRWVNNKLVQ